MKKVVLKTGELVEVENNEAHRLIDSEGASLVTSVEESQTYKNRMMSTEENKPYVTKRKRAHNAR